MNQHTTVAEYGSEAYRRALERLYASPLWQGVHDTERELTHGCKDCGDGVPCDCVRHEREAAR